MVVALIVRVRRAGLVVMVVVVVVFVVVVVRVITMCPINGDMRFRKRGKVVKRFLNS